MKRIIGLATVLILLLCFCACGNDDNVETIPAPTTSVLNLMPDGSIIVGELPSQQVNAAATPAQPTVAQEATTAEVQIDWMADIYNTVYNNTKADGTFLGSDSIVISDITVDGVKNSAVDEIVHSVMDSIYKPQTLPLPPYSEENPFPTNTLAVADIDHAEWKDLGNGQAELIVYPKQSVNSTLGEGQGKMFNVINDIGAIFDYLPGFTYGWSEGDTDSNVNTTYDGGYAKIVYDRVSMRMISAEYVMKLRIDITNFEILFASHNVSVSMTYTQTFPAVG